MKILLLLALLLTFSGANNYWDETDDKPYLQQRDNKAHILVSTAISGLVTYESKNRWNFTPTQAWFLGVAASMVVSFIKESSDKNFDMEDMSGYAIGGVIGSTAVYTF